MKGALHMPEHGRDTSANVAKSEDWRAIAERASKEQDPAKLIQLIEELCNLLEQQAATQKRKESPEQVRAPSPESHSQRTYS